MGGTFAMVTYGPTIIEIDFEGLGACAKHVSEVAASSNRTKQAMDRSQVSVSAFGLMNMPLGEVAHSLAVQARSLAETLSETSTQLSVATSVLRREWVFVEQEADDTAAKLHEILRDV
jgi:hypothetical protein